MIDCYAVPHSNVYVPKLKYQREGKLMTSWPTDLFLKGGWYKTSEFWEAVVDTVSSSLLYDLLKQAKSTASRPRVTTTWTS